MSNYCQDFNKGLTGSSVPLGGPTPGWHAGNNQRQAQEAQRRQQQQFQENMRRQQQQADDRRRQDEHRRAMDSRSRRPPAATAPATARSHGPPRAPRPPLYKTYPWLRRFSNVTALVFFVLSVALFVIAGLEVDMEPGPLAISTAVLSLVCAGAGKLLPLIVMKFARLLIILAALVATGAAVSFALEKL